MWNIALAVLAAILSARQIAGLTDGDQITIPPIVVHDGTRRYAVNVSIGRLVDVVKRAP